MELIYEHEDDWWNEIKTRALTTLDTPRQASMIQELGDHRRKLLQKRFRSSHLIKSLRGAVSSPLNQVDEQSKYVQIASLVPDEVILHPNNCNVRSFGASVIFADISGFTDMSTKYQAFDNGASRLSSVLNFYLGIMVQEILSHNGDVLKYAGDAFLAIFKADNQVSYQNAVQNAIDTCIIIQNYCRNFMTEIGVVLNVKLAISCGLVHFSLIGNEQLSHYVIVGEPIWQVKALQDHISGGEILLTSSAWFFTQNTLYTFEYMREYRCYKIHGFKDQTNIIRLQYEVMQYRDRPDGRSNMSESNTNLEMSYDAYTYDLMNVQEERFTVRVTISSAQINDSRKSLRRFISPTLLNAIDLGDNIDQLTEMRQVVILFANFVVPEKNPQNICKITNKIFTQLNSTVTSFEGSLNKVSLFDKDMMFLSIFGLRGQKLENECEVGLRCAHEVHKIFRTWSEIAIVSIGVTSGISYCGIVGHTLRREYSVISVTVNKAARLMMAYPGIISCDEDTLIRSKIDFLRHFKRLPKKLLKGLHADVRAFEFTDVIDVEEVEVTNEMEKNMPMVDRERVMQKMRKCVIAAIEAFNSNDRNYSDTSCFMIRGDGQQGKSRVINELYRECTHQNLKCLRLVLNAKHTSMPFFTVKYCLSKILESENEVTGMQDILANKLSDLIDDLGSLSVLNSIFETNFPSSSLNVDTEEFSRIRRLIIRILCHNLTENFWVIFIDDADYIDPDSFELLSSIFKTKTFFMLLTIGKHFRKWTLKQREIYSNNFVMHYRLQPIDKTFHRDIACRNINVLAIPIEFERFLHENSNGNPGWIETCANTLLYAGKLRRKSMMIKEAIDCGMVLINDLITKEWIDGDELDIFYDVNTLQLDNLEYLASDERIIYAVELTDSLTSKDFVSEYTTRKLMLYDTLSSHDQLVCKCAALLGSQFHRDMLNYLMPSSQERNIAKTIMKLFQQFILKCASPRPYVEGDTRKSTVIIVCNCKDPYIPDSCRDLPKYGNCSFIKFQDDSFRTYIYGTLTEKQRIDYHKRCFKYLCYNTKKCQTCNNERFREIEELERDSCDGVVEATKENQLRIKKEISKLVKPFPTETHPIVLNFINHNFHDCTCNNVLYMAFSRILHHCSQVKEMKMKTFFSQVTLADICIKLHNIPRALLLLHDCFSQLNDENNMYDNNSQFITYLRGRVLMLRGICSEKMMQYDEAIQHYYAASDLFEVKFPRKFNLAARLKLTHIEHVIRNSTKQYNKRALSRINSLISEQTTFLLQLFYEFYMKVGNFQLAKLAAFWSLKNVLMTERRIENVAKCFSSVLQICINSNDVDHKYEAMALREILKGTCNDTIDVSGLSEVVKLYGKILKINFLRNKITNAINVGEIAIKICYNLPSHENFIEIIPTLALLQFERIDAMKKLIIEFGGVVRHYEDKSGLIWYYALAMDLLLDTCQSLITYEECFNFYIEVVTSSHYVDQNQEAVSRFMANFWLWSIRNDMRERSERLMEVLRARFKLNALSTINDVFTGIRVVEALSLQYLNAIKTKNIASQSTLYELIEHYLNTLKYGIKSTKRCFSERILLHELHFKMINQEVSRKLFIRRMKMMARSKNLMKRDPFTFNYVRYLKFNLFSHDERRKNYWIEFNLDNSKNPQQIIHYLLPV